MAREQIWEFPQPGASAPATCVFTCKTCNGYTTFYIDPAPWDSPYPDNVQLSGIGHFSTGTQYDLTAGSTWSSNNTSVANVGNGSSAGLVSPVAAGSASMLATTAEIQLSGRACGDPPDCAELDGQLPASAAGNVARLICTPVTRGQTTNCTASAPSGATFSDWKFVDINGNSVTWSGTQAQWSGIAVQSGTVSVTVHTSDGQQQTVSSSLNVAARSNWSISPKPATRQANGYTCLDKKTVLSLPTTPYPNSDIGASCAYPYFSITDLPIVSGPNSGYDYVVSVTDNGEYSWAISPDVDNSGSQFYHAQCGNYNSSTNTGYIYGPTLDADDQRHEAGQVNAHYAEYVSAFNTPANNPGPVMEPFVEFTSQSQFESDAAVKLGQLSSAIANAAKPEPCGQHYAGFSATCSFDGPINFGPPYVQCQ